MMVECFDECCDNHYLVILYYSPSCRVPLEGSGVPVQSRAWFLLYLLVVSCFVFIDLNLKMPHISVFLSFSLFH